jgi:hypothetical protein
MRSVALVVFVEVALEALEHVVDLREARFLETGSLLE